MSKFEISSNGIDSDWIRENEVNEGPFYENGEEVVLSENGMVSAGEEIKALVDSIVLDMDIDYIIKKIIKKSNNLDNLLSNPTFKKYVSDDEYNLYLQKFNDIKTSFNSIDLTVSSNKKLEELTELHQILLTMMLEIRDKLNEKYLKVQETEKNNQHILKSDSEQKDYLIDQIITYMGHVGEFSNIPLEDIAQRMDVINDVKSQLSSKSIQVLEQLLEGYVRQYEDIQSVGKGTK